MGDPSPSFVDLSHQLADGMAPYPGLPDVHIGPHLDHEQSRANYDGDEFFLGKVDMPANVGTYVDAPFHRFPDREDLSQVPLDRLVGLDGVVLDATDQESRALGLDRPEGDIGGKAVLIRTGWDSRWGTEGYWEPGPHLTRDFAGSLIDAGVGLVGVDFWNVDDTRTRLRPIHTELLRAGVLIVEHLCHLDRLPSRGFRFFAPVLGIQRGASFPVRAFAELDRRPEEAPSS
ncbi:MAG TPA: cyclase family protein [Actinomycetota bacterium]|nr:cyclase family protein [Actinomycetota bacterium]